MQFKPDYSFIDKPDALEYKGPGWYLSKTNTVLAIPMPPEESATAQTVWQINQPAGTRIRYLVWNCSIDQLLVSCINTAPVREDLR